MTATLSASAPLERSLRMLPITANLLPPEIAGSRRTRKVRLVTISAVATVIAVIAAWYGLATYETASAESEVTAAQDRVVALRVQQKSFKELAGVQKDSAAIEAQLAALMKDDQKWSDVVSSVTVALPPRKAVLTVVNAALNDTKGPAPALLPNTSGQVLMGTLKISGYAVDKVSVAQYVKNLGSAAGVANAFLTSVIFDDQKGGYTFTVDADATTKVASTRFTAPKHASKGAK
jgi:Tfp pilus assembly protein PilN